MKIVEKIRKFLEKLQNLSEQQKKVILWVIVAIMAVIMGFFWVRGAIDSFSKLGGAFQNIETPETNTSNIPSLDILQTTTPSDGSIK